MSKKDIDMVALTPQKANAQNLTCFVVFIATAAIAASLMIAACALPALIPVTKILCWICMTFEAVAACLAWVSYWIKCNAL